MKLMQKISLFPIIFAFNMSITSAQIVPMKSGEILQDLTITNLYNTSLRSINFSELKGKIVIIDFWSTWCPGCIKALARMDSLQKKFDDKIFIIPVTPQSQITIEKFWKKNAITKTLRLLTVTDDTILQKIFTHNGFPSEFWIDKNGEFLSATDLEYVNEKEIESLIKGNKPHWVSASQKTLHDFSKKLIEPQRSISSTKCFYSVFLNFIPDEKTDFNCTIDSVNKTVKITCINFNIGGLYFSSLGDLPELKNSKRSFFNLKEPSKIKYNKSAGYKSEWDLKNSYCYELYWPLDDSCNLQPAFQRMRMDLDNFLRFKSDIKEIESDYYILVKLDGQDKLSSSTKNNELISLASLIKLWNANRDLPIIISPLKKLDQIFFDSGLTNLNDISRINLVLKSKGFLLKKETGKLPYFYLYNE